MTLETIWIHMKLASVLVSLTLGRAHGLLVARALGASRAVFTPSMTAGEHGEMLARTQGEAAARLGDDGDAVGVEEVIYLKVEVGSMKNGRRASVLPPEALGEGRFQ